MSERFMERFRPFARDGRLLADRQLIRAQARDVDFGNVIAERPHQFGDDDFRAGRHGAIAGRIELDEPHLAVRVADREARE